MVSFVAWCHWRDSAALRPTDLVNIEVKFWSDPQHCPVPTLFQIWESNELRSCRNHASVYSNNNKFEGGVRCRREFCFVFIVLEVANLLSACTVLWLSVCPTGSSWGAEHIWQQPGIFDRPANSTELDPVVCRWQSVEWHERVVTTVGCMATLVAPGAGGKPVVSQGQVQGQNHRHVQTIRCAWVWHPYMLQLLGAVK